MNFKYIYDDHVSTDMKYKKFQEFCSKRWRDGNNSFFVIDKDRDLLFMFPKYIICSCVVNL